MRIKMAFAAALTLVMIAGISGCAGKKQAQIDITNIVDLSHYTLSKTSDSESSSYYTLNADLNNKQDLDHTMVLDGVELIYPLTFEELGQKGWKISSEDAANEEMKPSYAMSSYCENSAGHTIYVMGYNHLAEAAAYDKCTVKDIEITVLSSDDKYSKALKSAPEFIIYGSITNASTIQDIINVLGEPSAIRTNGNLSKITITYDCNDGDIQFDLTSDGQHIILVDIDTLILS